MSNMKIYGCFVDFSKAFDSLPRDILFKKIFSYGITGRFLMLWKFYIVMINPASR